MANHIYKKIEVVGTSPDSYEKAIQHAVAKASESVRNLRWFEVVESRGAIDGGKISEYQVTLKVAFTLED